MFDFIASIWNDHGPWPFVLMGILGLLVFIWLLRAYYRDYNARFPRQDGK